MDTIILLLLGLAMAGNVAGFAFLFMASKDDGQESNILEWGTKLEDKKAKIKKEQEQYKYQKQQEEMEKREKEAKSKQQEDQLRFKEQQDLERYKQEQAEIRRREEEEKYERQRAEEEEMREAEERARMEEQKRRMLEEEQEQFNFKQTKKDDLHERFDINAQYDKEKEYQKPIEQEEVVIEIKDLSEKDRTYQFDPSNMMLERERKKEKEENPNLFKKEETKIEEDYSKYFDDYEESEEERAKREVSSIMNNIDHLERTDEELEGFRKQHQFSEEERRALEYGDKSLYDIKENKVKQELDVDLDIESIHEKYYGKKEKTKRELFETADMEKERPNTIFEDEEEKKKETINIKELEPSKYENKVTIEDEVEEMNDDEMNKRISFLMERMNKNEN